MKTLTKLALAGMLATSSLGGVAMAQSAMPQAEMPIADDGVTIVQLSSLNDHSTRSQYDTLKLKATDPDQVAAAQAEVSSDPMLVAALEDQHVQMNNIIHVDTAADGSKIVYVR